MDVGYHLALGPLLAWLIPGLLLVRTLFAPKDALETTFLALALGIVTVSPTVYLVSLLGKTVVTPTLIGLVVLMWSLVGAGLSLYIARPAPQTADGTGSGRRYLLLFALATAFICSACTELYAMDTTSIWWHCPHLSSLYMLQDGTGAPVLAWTSDYNTFSTHLLAHPSEPGFGLAPVLGLQRPGNTAFLLIPLAFMSTGGLIFAVLITDFLLLTGAMLLVLRGLTSDSRVAPFLAGATALCFLLGTRAMASYQVNENCIALALSLAALYLLTDSQPTRTTAAVAGLIMAHIVGIRPSTVLMVIASVTLLARPTLMIAFAGALLAGGAVWMTAHAQALGDPLAHPALTYGYQQQTIFGLDVTFHPLWVPFMELMRPPNHPYPSLIRIPLEVYQAYGAVLLTSGLCGLVALRQQRKNLLAVVLWVLPLLLPLLAIVELDQQKMSYVLLVMAPLPWLVGLGIGRLSLELSGRLALIGCSLLAFVFIPPMVRDLTLPVDTRTHGDYRREGRDLWPEAERRQWLTRTSLLPAVADHLDLRQTLGLDLLSRSILAHTTATVHDGPITVWAGLPPAGLSHQFKVKTTEQPLIQKDFLDISGGSAAGGLPGRVTFLVELPAPGATVADVVLERRDSRYHLTIQSDTSERSETARYLTLTIVDRTQTRVGSPTIEIDGKRASTRIVTMGRLDANEWVTEPRLVSNVDALDWFNPGPLNSGLPVTSPGMARCKSSRFDLRPIGRKVLLTDTNRPVAVTYRSGQGKGRYLSLGRTLAHLHHQSDDCIDSFLRVVGAVKAGRNAPSPNEAPGRSDKLR